MVQIPNHKLQTLDPKPQIPYMFGSPSNPTESLTYPKSRAMDWPQPKGLPTSPGVDVVKIRV